ncbi:hypothetical protein GRS96_20320 (plasmid) [Rathayibacter sp. VKM Ac-2803]|uniref:hypothetical protein n=1 Tax=Rathayibacter sp. VKM Ac-2803 TaxID=2609256 RepID=UPI00135CE80A|nr:hypothetical protein [Rathayibacter sp. VKM Ac-2803]MWV51614.1 hypothetical protein [Rathayibacter sp. VKM Ac-2803]
MARSATVAVHDSGSNDGRSWLTRLFRRTAAEPLPAAPVRVPREPQTAEQIIAQYTRMVQGFVDDDPTQPPGAVFVCGVGPMTVNVDGDGRVALTPRPSMS